MTRSLNSQQVILLLGTALVIGVVMVIVIYALHSYFRREHKAVGLKPAALRPTDESAFLLVSMRDVVAEMKEREKQLESLLREAEERAETSTRKLEALAREIPQGVMVFDREGFLTQANQPAGAILGTDSWSRRRYPEIFSPGSAIAELLEQCLIKGRGCRRERLRYTAPSGRTQNLEVSISPYHRRGGQLAGALCIIAVLS